MTEISVFVSKKEGGKDYIENMLKETYDEDCYLIGEGHNYKIEEATIEDYNGHKGDLQMMINGSDGLYYSISIPFQEWIYQAIRFGWFEDINNICGEKKADIEQIRKRLRELKKIVRPIK